MPISDKIDAVSQGLGVWWSRGLVNFPIKNKAPKNGSRELTKRLLSLKIAIVWFFLLPGGGLVIGLECGGVVSEGLGVRRNF